MLKKCKKKVTFCYNFIVNKLVEVCFAFNCTISIITQIILAKNLYLEVTLIKQYTFIPYWNASILLLLIFYGIIKDK